MKALGTSQTFARLYLGAKASLFSSVLTELYLIRLGLDDRGEDEEDPSFVY
jgi:hypothetical protein